MTLDTEDCVVRAYAAAYDLPEDDVRRALGLLGRPRGAATPRTISGPWLWATAQFVATRHARLSDLPPTGRYVAILYMPTRALASGWATETDRHFVAVLDGIVVDSGPRGWPARLLAECLIDECWRVSPMSLEEILAAIVTGRTGLAAVARDALREMPPLTAQIEQRSLACGGVA